jgi:hypothetical protein
MFIHIAQVSGSLLILTAFVLAQFRGLGAESPAYLGLNLTGSLALAILAATGGQWGFLLLEGTWAAISAFRLISVFRARHNVPRPEATHRSGRVCRHDTQATMPG